MERTWVSVASIMPNLREDCDPAAESHQLRLYEKSEIPPTAVGGLFILCLQTGAPDPPFSSPSFPSRSERKEGERIESGGQSVL